MLRARAVRGQQGGFCADGTCRLRSRFLAPHWADAKVVGDTVVVSASEVPNPVAARYAWQANPKATLFNGAGLPAIPFRTDDLDDTNDNKKLEGNK